MFLQKPRLLTATRLRKQTLEQDTPHASQTSPPPLHVVDIEPISPLYCRARLRGLAVWALSQVDLTTAPVV
ncbi:MAG: hypothetical protein QXD08_09350 [Pyrobaculum sp.]